MVTVCPQVYTASSPSHPVNHSSQPEVEELEAGTNQSSSMPTSGLTQELHPKVAGFREQRPADNDLLSRVEGIPHDQGDAWGVQRVAGTQ